MVDQNKLSNKSSSRIEEANEPEAVQQDDEVIAVFFRRSMLSLAAAAVLGVSVYWFMQPKTKIEQKIATVSVAPQMKQQNEEPKPTSVRFVDVTIESGIDFVHNNGAYGAKLLPETMGGGVALFDYDNDGLIDILFVNSSSWPEQTDKQKTTHHLYRNLGNWQFDDVTRAVGLDQTFYGMGVAIGDYDGDGFSDVYLTAVGKNRLFRNIDGKSFAQVSLGVEGDDADWSTSAAFFDIDGDGDLDLFVCNYVEWSKQIDFDVDYQLTGIGRAYGPPTNYKGTHSRLFRNDEGSFADISAAAGIQVSNPATGLPIGKALALKPIDLNHDGLLDIVVANDTVQNFVFMNQGDGQFSEEGAIMGMAFDNSGHSTGAMGVDSSYYKNDNDVAIVIANFANEMTSFYVAQDNAVFTDESIVSGIGPDSRRTLSFGLFFFDYDLDGRNDLLTANGHVENDINVVQPSQQHAQQAQLFWNCGDQCRRVYKRVDSASSGDLSQALIGRGAASADLDNDGDLDVVITQAGDRPAVYRNELFTQSTSDSAAPRPNWIRLKLRTIGKNTVQNTAAIGAQVTLRAGGAIQKYTVMPTKSYLSQSPDELTIGLGDAEQVSIEVRWPDGKTNTYNDLEVNRAHTIKH